MYKKDDKRSALFYSNYERELTLIKLYPSQYPIRAGSEKHSSNLLYSKEKGRKPNMKSLTRIPILIWCRRIL